MKSSLTSSLERLFHKHTSNNEVYINTYCYSKHTDFSNDCRRWLIHNISKDVDEYTYLCYEFETDVVR